MEKFTCKDYFVYLEYKEKVDFLNNKNNSYVCEELEPYNYTQKSPINNQHDKIFRTILDDKNEAAKLINKTLKLRYTIKPQELEKYSSSFVTKELKNQEADIIYKLKRKNVFFLIEHQTKVDYSMPYRILQYQVEIIKSAINIKQINSKNYQYPIIYPIVLYSGKGKWNAKLYLKEIQERLESYETEEMAKYNLVDVNDFSEEELLQDDSFLSKIMLLEKIRYTEKLEKYLPKILDIIKQQKMYTKEQKELFITIITLITNIKIKGGTREEQIKKLNREEEDSMLAILEAMEEENKMIEARGVKKGIKKGIKEANRETAKKMLEENTDIAFISRVTGLTEKQIMKLKVQKNK